MNQRFYNRPQVWVEIGITIVCLIAVSTRVDLNKVSVGGGHKGVGRGTTLFRQS